MIDRAKLKEYTTKISGSYVDEADKGVPIEDEHLTLIEQAMYDVARQMSVTYGNKKKLAKSKLAQEKRHMGWQ